MTDPPSVAGVREGDILAGKYRIDRILGAGGMGVVVAAHHIHLDERVAIKFLLPEMLTVPEAVARFAREARAAVKIKSEHVARVQDVGTLENGAPYMVMEYLDGIDLSAWLAQQGPLSIQRAVEFVLQACEAIAEAHMLGIVHRDLKPANLFVIRRPDSTLSVKVLDFGISKMRDFGSSAPDVSITRTSAMMGSPLYSSPEQLQSAKDVDARTDIWALGVVLFELVTGETPFVAQAMPELIAQILSVQPPLLRTKRPDAPVELEAVILKCIEKDRGKRFESVGELAAALIPLAPRESRLSLKRITGVMRSAGLSASALASPPWSDPNDQAGGATQNAWGRTNAPRRRATLTAVVAIILAVLGAAAFFSLRATPAGDAKQAAAEPQAASKLPPIASIAAPWETPRVTPSTRAPSIEAVPATPAVTREPVTNTEDADDAGAPAPAPPARTAKRAVKRPTSRPASTVAPKAPVKPQPKAPGAFDERM